MGLIHLDAGVVIGFLDADDIHHAATHAALARAQRNGDRLAMAASALAECLVGPARRGARAIEVVESLIERLPIEIVHLDQGIALAAAKLRARHTALRLPDALVIATADGCSADELVTTDRKWPKASVLRVGPVITRL